MPQPPEVAAVADELAAAYRRVAQIIADTQAALLTDPAHRRLLAAQLRNRVNAALDDLDAQTRAWVLDRFPTVYVLGAESTVEALGLTLDPFALVHQAALHRILTGLERELLAATRFVRRDVKRFIRDSARLVTEAKLREGETAVHAAARLAKIIDDHGIKGITYKDGSRHTVDDYADMAIRTETALAYNEGTLNAASSAGVLFYEIFDGAGCGLTSHDDTDKANGMILDEDGCRANPLSHPRCQRSFGARPDLTSADGGPSTTAASRADQAAFERQRATTRPSRQPRVPRTPRSVRA